MKDVTTGRIWGQDGVDFHDQEVSSGGFFNEFYNLARQSVQGILMHILESEASAFIEKHRHLVDEQGHRHVVRNGHARPRKIVTDIGALEVRTPRIHSRTEGISFVSRIIPPYMRRDPQIGDMVALLYVNGISTNKMQGVLQEYYGEALRGFSSSNVTKILEACESEYKQWKERDLSDKRYVYMWADGIHFTVRGTTEKLCVLVILGVTEDGHKEVLSISSGQRESQLSWKEQLLDLQKRGLEHCPRLAVADGAQGFWEALREVYPRVREQRCWVHKIRNVLDKMPKSLQKDAKRLLHDIMNAPNKAEALKKYQTFIRLYEDKHPKAVECLRKDMEQLLTFYDFPAAHWRSIRSTNAIESTFATVRRRMDSTGGRCTENATVAMVYKLSMAAQRNWRRLNKYPFLEKVQAGYLFIDGEIAETEMTQVQKAA